MSDKCGSDEEVYSYKSSKTVYKRSRSRPSSAVSEYKVYISTDEEDRSTSEYQPVSKWAVDYNNKNYIRSLCNKNKGLHRKLKGRPHKFKIQYDNNYFTQSKVNPLKGLHRKIPEIKRKYVPDNDELADAIGWEFDCGPEFDQPEQDVNYIPEGRIVRRGCYRWYGAKRNDSDCDIKLDDERENLLNEELKQELKYGQEFLQSDRPYLEEQRNRRYTRGGYRFYEVLRNIHDFKPEELAEATRDPEWRRKYHCNGVRHLDLGMCECDRDDIPEHRHHVRKGKPFRRTILNKVYQLIKEDSSKDIKRHATRLSLIPGEGRQSLYEGMSDRVRYGVEKSPSIRSAYTKKTEKYRSAKGEEYEEFETEDTEKSYTEVRPTFERRLHRTPEIKHSRRPPDEDLIRKEKGSRRYDEYPYRVKPEAFDKRRTKEKHYDHGEHPSQRRTGSSRDRRHGNQIYKQTEVKSKTRDRHYIDSHLQHISTRGKVRRDGDMLEKEVLSGKEQVLKKKSPRVEQRIRNIRERLEVPSRKGKEQVAKKMPPEVEERITNIRKRMERKLDTTDRKHKGRRDEAFGHSCIDDGIDLMKHKGHPKDRGETHSSEYEKYVTENGSELWVKKNETYAELHHKHHT